MRPIRGAVLFLVAFLPLALVQSIKLSALWLAVNTVREKVVLSIWLSLWAHQANNLHVTHLCAGMGFAGVFCPCSPYSMDTKKLMKKLAHTNTHKHVYIHIYKIKKFIAFVDRHADHWPVQTTVTPTIPPPTQPAASK